MHSTVMNKWTVIAFIRIKFDITQLLIYISITFSENIQLKRGK